MKKSKINKELDVEAAKKKYHIGEEKVLPSKFTSEQLLNALYWVFDFMDRALLDFYLVGTTADRVLKHMELDGEDIQVAIRRLEWESGARRIADAFALPLKDEGKIVRYEFKGVPITLYVLEDSTTMQQADTQIYHSEYFRIPSPYSQFLNEFPFLRVGDGVKVSDSPPLNHHIVTQSPNSR